MKPLITNKDIKLINAKLSTQGSLTSIETALLQESQKSESEIQIACHNIIKDRYSFLNHCEVEFVQIDNGGKIQMKTKKAEGTQKGFFDVVIWVREKYTNWVKLNEGKTKQIFIEFKKIGSYTISPEQQAYHDHHKEWGESVHFCNNTPYFEQNICKEIDSFLLINN